MGRETDLEILVIPAAALDPATLGEIIALCEVSYAEDFSGLVRDLAPLGYVLGRHHGALVSHALWCARALQPAGGPILRTAYVEAVATRPGYRGRGYAAAVLTRLVAVLAGYDLVALSPAHAHVGLYARLGFRMWRGPLSVRAAEGLLPTPGDCVMVLRLPGTPPLDLDTPLSAEWRPGELW